MTTRTAFAIDVGGVLASQQHDGSPTQDACSTIEYLSDHYDLWIVSMCGKGRALQTKKWLTDFEFDRFIPKNQWIFIPFEDKNKNAVLRKINAKFFVDDRMKHIGPVLNNYSSITCFHMITSGNTPVDSKWATAQYVPVYGWTDIHLYMQGKINYDSSSF